MRHNKLKTVFAWLAVLSIAIAGDVLAQPVTPSVPSLVTQQSRLSTGGATPSYINFRAKGGVGSSSNYYSWDQAPAPTSGTNYSLWLDQANNIETSVGFGPTIASPGPGFGQPLYLQRVNAAGTGLEWVKPNDLVQANNGLFLDNTTTPGVDIVQLGGATSGTANLLSDRFVTLGGKALNFDGAGSFNVGTPSTVVNMTFDPGTTGFITLNDITTSLTTTKLLTLDASNHVITRDLSTLVVADEGLSINPTGGYVELGTPAGATTPAVFTTNRFVGMGGKGLSFTGAGTFNIGDGSGILNTTIDVGATGALTVKNIAAATPAATDRFVVLDAADKAFTRTVASLVTADNGTNVAIVNGVDNVELGGPLTKATAIDQATFGMTWTNGTMNLGAAGGNYNVNIDLGATTNNMNIKNLLADNATTVFLTQDATGNVRTRSLSTLVVADEGLSINSTGGFVELGTPAGAATPAVFTTNRFVGMGGKNLTFNGAGNFNIGDASGVLNTTIDVGAGGALDLKNITAATPAATDRFVVLDGTDKAFTRTVASLVTADNGTNVTVVNGVDNVELGGPLTKATAIDQATFGMTWTNGTMNLGAAGGNYNVNIDLGATTNNMNIKNLLSDNTTTVFLTQDATGNVRTRALSSIVNADNGLSINAANGNVELGGPSGTPSALLNDRYVALSTFAMNFNGAGSFTVGDGTAAATNITLDEGTGTGSINFKNVANDATPASTDRFVVMAAASDKVLTRSLSSLVNANNGLIVDNTVTPGTSTVQLGATAPGDVPSALGANRFINMNGKTLNFEQNGVLNLGTAGAGGSNMAVNVNTGTSDMTITGANLASPANTVVPDVAFVDATNVVHTITPANMVRDNAAVDFIAIDHTTGGIVKAVSPTAGIYRGHVSWTGWQQTITLPAGQTIAANASITATIENHASAGSVVIQITNVGATTFDIETADTPTAGSFINYIVINP
jgi:hypothetical protein